MTTPIEDYAFIGDQHTGALVSRAGSIDWLCLPDFDSPACFAAVLGAPEHGRWLLTPAGEATMSRRYVADSLVLETVHETSSGSVRVTDFMPTETNRADVLRRVEGLSGSVVMRHEWVVRPWYGKRIPWIDDEGGGVVSATAGPDRLTLRGTRLPHQDEDRVFRDEFTVAEGEVHFFKLTWQPSHHPRCDEADLSGLLEATVAADREWLARCEYDGPYREAVRRSLLVLRALTHRNLGGIVAAPTASLPEDFGGERNWDYRYCWLRDAALTIEALLGAGYQEGAELWRDWLVRAVAGDPTHMQIMYTIRGGHDLPERELDHLPGYLDSRPVHIGNAAVEQRQTDVLGEVMVALSMARDLGVAGSRNAWELQVALVDDLASHWEDPDNGIWEIRGPLKHFTHSRVMVWAAFDRAVDACERYGLPGDVDRWRELAERVRQEVWERGFDERRGTFTQHYDTDEVDASLLLLPHVGFVGWDDPAFAGTVETIEGDLMEDGLLLRYRTASGVDGLSGEEHPFLICCFWLVSAYARMGRVDDARELMDRLVGLANDVGLLAEESNRSGEFAGNFPQAFSHLGLVNAALDLARIEEGGMERYPTPE